MEPPSDAMLAALQEHIEKALQDQALPPLRAEQWRTHLAKVKAAREKLVGQTPHRRNTCPTTG